MPELPEVETVCRGLSEHLTGKRITRVVIRRHTLRVPLPSHLAEALAGRTLKAIGRRAKYILFHLDDAQVLIIHLGMSGKMLLKKKTAEPFLSHDHVIMHWSDSHILVFNDARRFGLMLLTTEELLAGHPLMKHLGAEPLEDAWNGAALYAGLHASKAPVKSVLMDQRKLAGVGNIYACEALFLAKIHPARAANKITRAEAGTLACSVKDVLKAAIASGGSTLRDYVRSSGDAGYFQHHFNVYGRVKRPCPRCGTPIAMIRQSGRSSFFCKTCQR